MHLIVYLCFGFWIMIVYERFMNDTFTVGKIFCDYTSPAFGATLKNVSEIIRWAIERD